MGKYIVILLKILPVFLSFTYYLFPFLVCKNVYVKIFFLFFFYTLVVTALGPLALYRFAFWFVVYISYIFPVSFRSSFLWLMPQFEVPLLLYFLFWLQILHLFHLCSYSLFVLVWLLLHCSSLSLLHMFFVFCNPEYILFFNCYIFLPSFCWWYSILYICCIFLLMWFFLQ